MMVDKKFLPIGFSDFREIITGNYYFVDKSLLIEELLHNMNKVTLITRPRRFGKTLNMTMLREFFSLAVDSKDIFSGLKIMNTKYAKELNKYPVLFFSFKDVKGDKKDIITGIKRELQREWDRYDFLEESLSAKKRIIFARIEEALLSGLYDDLDKINNGISFLTEILHEHYKVQPILIIDEYDTPMISAYEYNIFEEFRGFFTNLYSSALKDNINLKIAVLTGIQRVSKENIFSGLNNIKVCTVLDEEYNKYFGLTVAETKEFLAYYGGNLTEEVSAMYNGYNFAGERIFNPWSIINYGARNKLEPYWVNTSSNKFIYDLIKRVKFDIADVFEKLVIAGEVTLSVDLATTFFEMNNEANFWGLLLNAGYLTLAKQANNFGRLNSYRIPNGEVKEEFKKLAATYTEQEYTSMEKMFDALLGKEVQTFAAIYQKMLLQSISFYDRRENAYHMLFLGMSFYLYDRYDIKSNREVGDGRADLVYTAKYRGEPHLIVEIKYAETEKEEALKKLAVSALEQIKAKKYYIELIGDVVLVGVAHSKKEVQVAAELITMLEK